MSDASGQLVNTRFKSNSMGLAEAAAHLAALAALSWLLQHVRAREALAIVDDRLAAGGARGAWPPDP